MSDDTTQVQDASERNKQAGLIPKAGDPKVGHRVFKILADVIQDKVSQGLHSKWLEYYRLGRNVHWQRGSKAVPLVSANLLHPHRQRTVNTLTDNDPSFNIMSLSQEDRNEAVEKLQKACMYWWNEQEQQTIYEETVRNGETYGITIEKVIFDPEVEYGVGEISTILVDPFYFGIYPTKCKHIQKADAVLYYYPMSVREAKRRWPDKADQIKPDSEFLDQLGSERREIQAGNANDGVLARIGLAIRALVNRAGGEDAHADPNDDDILIVECWIKDYSGVYIGNIRCVTVCGGGHVVLEDKDNPSINPNLPPEDAMHSYLYDKFPFTKSNSVTDPANFWGMSDYEQLEQLQKEFNKSISQMVFLKDKSARPKIINPKDSGVDNSEFTNAPGIINPSSVATSQGIRYLDFPQLPRDMEQIAGLLKDLFFLVAGTFELENAQTPGREVIAHKAIAVLIEHASTMMRGKIRNYSSLLRERGRMFISHAQNWYTEVRWFTWDVGNKNMVGSIRNDEIQFPIRLTVLNGSTLPTPQASKREEAMKLAEMGMIDQEDLLEKLDWSNRDETIARMKQGPQGELLGRMEAMGIPPEITEVIGQIAQMKPEDFDKAMKAGEIPMLSPPDAEAADPLKQGEIGMINAKIQVEQANRELILAKTDTERVMQQVHQAAIDFDQKKIAIEGAETNISGIATMADIAERSAASEREDEKAIEGMVDSHHSRAMAVKTHADSLVQADKDRAFRERGLKTNNRQPGKK